MKNTEATADAVAINKMKTAIVILNWNTEGFLKDFLPGLLHSVSKVKDAEVIVADNASTDGSLQVMKQMFPDVRTIELDRNYGFTGGYNKAFELIDSDLFVLINSDIEVTRDWLEPLVKWMEDHPECGACAPKLHSWQERDRFEYAGAAGGYIDRFGYPFCRGRIMGKTETDNGQYDSPSDVLWATGACLMVRSSLYRRLGGLDERFFAHMEEIDLCWRMQLEGYKVTVVPDSTVYHVGGGTLPATSPFKLYLNYRNNLLMLENNLAKTFALGYKDIPVGKAASKACRKASGRIFTRKCLDAMSAAVYLLTFRIDCFKSVLKAHRDAASMRRTVDEDAVATYLKEGKGEVKGVYRRWIIPRAIIKGSNIFKSIDEKDFYKF